MDGAVDDKNQVLLRVSGAMTLFLMAFLFTTLGSLGMAAWGGAWALFGVCLILLQATFMTGALLGFIFSVPRVLARANGSGDPADGAGVGGTTNPGKRLMETNSNLERISDWLATLLVGAGLTQLNDLGPAMVSFSRFIADSLPIDSGATLLPGIAPMILVIGTVLGFLCMYLYTRVELARLFLDTESEFHDLTPEAQRAVAGAIRVVEAQTLQAGGKAQDGGGSGARAMTQPASAASPTVSVDDALNVMFDLLYRPEGYHRVLTLAPSLASSPAAERPDFWFYIAAAAGQQHAAAMANGRSEEASAARQTALDAARRAVQLDASYRERLRLLTTDEGQDNDLVSLREDADLATIIGGQR